MSTRDALFLAHREAASALETPAVRFLRRKQAPFVVAVFRTAFGPEVPQVQTHVLHLLVEEAQDELGAEGFEVPSGTGRDVCRGWLRDEWIRRLSSNDDTDVYVKTAHAEDSVDDDRAEHAGATAIVGVDDRDSASHGAPMCHGR